MSTPDRNDKCENVGLTVEVRQIEFQFKGPRDYIHGTDIFNAMTSSCLGSVVNNIRFTVHDFVLTPVCNLHIADARDDLNEVAEIRARCQFEENGRARWLALTAGEGDTASGGRYEYDEERIISLCRMGADGIALAQQSPNAFIENIVAMNKYMHRKLFPEAPGQWVFTRIDLDVFCEERENLALRFKHNMNYRLTKSDILVDGKRVGALYFSLIKS